MAAFGWAETYHRNARRKSVFHAAAALCDISLSAAADHACTCARRYRPNRCIGMAPRMSTPFCRSWEKAGRPCPAKSKKIPRHDRQHDNNLRSGGDARPARSGARLASCQPGLAAQPSQAFNLKFRLTLMRFICRWAPHFDGPVVRVTEFYALYPTNSDSTATKSRRSTGARFRRLMLLLANWGGA